MNKFALLIGVNKYNFLTPLNFAVQDAESTAEALKSCYGFRDNEICLMTDSKNQMLYPSLENVQKQIQFLKQNHDLELLIVGFWGHSFALKADERYLCAILTQEEELVRTGLPLQQVIAELKQVQALNTCLILDCCQSRAGGRGGAQSFAGREALSRDIVLAQRPAVPGQRRRVPTMAILNACDDQEKAYEWDEKGHGLFTKFLLDGMYQRHSSLAQLASYVTQNVADTAERVLGKTQNPFVVMQGAGDIPLSPTIASPVLPAVASPVLPPPPPQIRAWWYSFPGQPVQGPVPEDDFQLMIQNGQIVRGTHIWTEGRDWVKVESASEFAKYYKDASSAPVTPSVETLANDVYQSLGNEAECIARERLEAEEGAKQQTVPTSSGSGDFSIPEGRRVYISTSRQLHKALKNEDNAVLILAPGTYELSKYSSVCGKNLSIYGNPTNPGLVKIHFAEGEYWCFVGGNQGSIIGVDIVGKYGVFVRDSGTSMTLLNCVLHDCENGGIFLYNGARADVRNCEIRNCNGEGIFVSDSGTNIQVENCRISGCGDNGIYIVRGRANVSNCEVRDNKNFGVRCLSGATGTFSENRLGRNGTNWSIGNGCTIMRTGNTPNR